MGIAWSTYKSTRVVKAKAKRYKVTTSLDITSRLTSQKFLQLFPFFFFHRLRNENRVRIPDYQGFSERLFMETFEMKENNLLLEENIHVDGKELATSEEWKLPYKSLR